tara:strand:+ start:161 stop:754 length:594 start_codon:yes stop_codon:yes gene_type:complete
MPTPIGHALGGIAAGYLVSGVFACARSCAKRYSGTPAAPSSTNLVVGAVTLACMGMLPDIDFVFAAHREFTHSVGATAAVMVVAAALSRWRYVELPCAVGAAYASHIGLDWLAADSSFPAGLMALWPFTTDYYLSSYDYFLFLNVCRQIGEIQCWMNNGFALLRELTILVPVTIAAISFQRLVTRKCVRRGSQTKGS